MSDKLFRSVSSLRSWSDKILNDVGRRTPTLEAFLLDFNIGDYRRFYGELQPFLEDLARQDPERFGNFVATYRENGLLLDAAMQENNFARIAGSLLFGFKPMARRANDLVDAIRQVKLNAENFETSLALDR